MIYRDANSFATCLFVLFTTLAMPMLALLGCGGSVEAARSVSSTPSGVTSALEDTRTTSSVIPPGQRLRGDGDADNPSDIDGNGDSDSAAVGGADEDNDGPTPASYRFPDGDDGASFAYGHAPSARERRVIANVVRRYYAAGSSGDGRGACALLVASFARMVAQAYLHGARTCVAVLSKLFAHYRDQLSEAVTVVQVRVTGAQAQAILSSRRMPASSIVLERQSGSWRVEELFGQPLP
jgi:hypothetical protein